MNRPGREWEIKLDLLDSLAKSQAALAKMLEAAAQVISVAGISPAVLREHIRALDGMQAALLHAVSGTRWRPPKRGRPASPWLKRGVCSEAKKEPEVMRAGSPTEGDTQEESTQ